MSLKKQYLKSKPLCKVTFTLDKKHTNDAKNVSLLGDFNDWKEKKSNLMRKQKDGSFARTLDLEVGRVYQFRYLLDGETWFNDPKADGYALSEYGSENCLVEV
ncbi:MAG TPA: isoamylase early set domain-containing protein [Saprospiraceae bacterium]|nr:isoamylase early set domain-containing protein [Saprospiraceae bacterium]